VAENELGATDCPHKTSAPWPSIADLMSMMLAVSIYGRVTPRWRSPWRFTPERAGGLKEDPGAAWRGSPSSELRWTPRFVERSRWPGLLTYALFFFWQSIVALGQRQRNGEDRSFTTDQRSAR